MDRAFRSREDEQEVEVHGYELANSPSRDSHGWGEDICDLDSDGLAVFNVAGVSFRSTALQSASFQPGSALLLVAEPKNRHDRNAVAVWDAGGQKMVGYVPRGIAPKIGAALRSRRLRAMALREFRKGGNRVALRVAVTYGEIAANATATLADS